MGQPGTKEPVGMELELGSVESSTGTGRQLHPAANNLSQNFLSA